MSVARMITASAAALFVPLVLAAQSAPTGTMSFKMNFKPPAQLAAQAPMPIDKMPTLMFTVGADGKRMGMEMRLGEATEMPFVMLGDMSIRTLVQEGSDSVYVAVSVPEALRPTLAGLLAPEAGEMAPPGYAMAVMIPSLDSLMKLGREKADLELDGKGPKPTFKATGTTSTVGGMQCENWRIIGVSDSARAVSDTIDMCLVDRSKVHFPMMDWLDKKLGMDKLFKDSGMSDVFGGRSMFAIRAAMGDQFQMEMVSNSTAAPAAEFFAIPSNFKRISAKDLPIPDMDGT